MPPLLELSKSARNLMNQISPAIDILRAEIDIPKTNMEYVQQFKQIKFISESPPPSVTDHLGQQAQEQHNELKKPRNYKYWSDNEVRRILHWLTLPENEGKLTRNKAQACREVAKILFDGDEYMAISVRSKLMALEKAFREAEQLRLQLSHTTSDEAIINDKIEEVNKFYKECKILFGAQEQYSNGSSHIPSSSTSPPALSLSNPFSSSSSSSAPRLYQPTTMHALSYPNNEVTSSTFEHSSNSASSSLLPQLNEERLRALPVPSNDSIHHHQNNNTSWPIPRVSFTGLPPQLEQHNETTSQSLLKRNNESQVDETKVKVARYAAKQAEYEALRSDHERRKMEYAVRLAEINLERDTLAIKKLELELEMTREQAKGRDRTNTT
ncbi:MAG: hypothetical protein EXX96DRAFT_648593 [Benjaminiella poitrasii]|nr:MAG: hypothetical protein EXX96DRAFT_648593 [Benjaminiella poitrasii]